MLREALKDGIFRNISGAPMKHQRISPDFTTVNLTLPNLLQNAHIYTEAGSKVGGFRDS